MAELTTGSQEVDVEHIVVKGPDGTAVDAIHARPDGMPLAGLVLHPDVMGVRPLFDDLCRRLATHGFAVCCPEPFARAPMEVRAATETEARLGYLAELDDDLQIGDLEAAADYLVVHDDVREVAVMGFCMGGMQTLKAAASGRFDRAVAFYGMVRVPDEWVGPKTRRSLDTAAEVCPTLAIFGGRRSLLPGSRHRRAARRVGRPARLRDRRLPRGRPRVRARARAAGAPGRRCRRRLAPRAGVPAPRLTSPRRSPPLAPS